MSQTMINHVIVTIMHLAAASLIVGLIGLVIFVGMVMFDVMSYRLLFHIGASFLIGIALGVLGITLSILSTGKR